MVTALLRRLLAISVLVGVPLGSLWVLFGDNLPQSVRPTREPGAEETPFVSSTVTDDLSEEHPFLMSNGKRYRDLYPLSNREAKNARSNYGTAPFDFPSAQSCLHGSLPEGAPPTHHKLAWDKLLTVGAVEVCLVRVMRRFLEVEKAVAWLGAQGLARQSGTEPIAPDDSAVFFLWNPATNGGPHALWNAMSERERSIRLSFVVTMSFCSDPRDCSSLDAPIIGSHSFAFDVGFNTVYHK
ncbi:MAG: hypothetical protein RSE12_15145 [Fuscovulum sp.]|nr:MAG: hypothetical protein RSE12_15145 [Fuscovulum sp.]